VDFRQPAARVADRNVITAFFEQAGLDGLSGVGRVHDNRGDAGGPGRPRVFRQWHFSGDWADDQLF
jgi:hypothetical protein